MLCIPSFLQRLAADYPRSLHGLDVADVAQEAARRVWDRRHAFDGRARLTTWCCGIAHLTFLEELRRVTKRAAREEDCPTEALYDQPASDNVSEAVLTGFEVERLRRVIAGLAPIERAMLRARIFHGQSFAELGTAHGLSESAAKARYYRAFDKVKASMKGKDTAQPATGESQR